MKYFLSRLLQAFAVWVFASFVVFLLVRLIPGDPVLQLVPPYASDEDIAEYRSVLGLDQPWYLQYFAFISRVGVADFGDSFVYRRPVIDLIASAVPITLQVLVAGFVLAVAIAVPLGTVSAFRRGSLLDRVIGVFMIVAQSVPTFWLGFLLIAFFSLTMHWLPTSGYGTPAHIVMPALAIAAWVSGIIAAVTRESLIAVLDEPYITTAHSKGLKLRRVIMSHALRNASIQISTVVALELGYLISGAVVTEVVFGLPGIGSLAYAAILQRDYPLVQGVVLTAAAGVLLINVGMDVLYRYLDPRTRAR